MPGNDAASPTRHRARFGVRKGFVAVRRVHREIIRDHVPLVSAGIAFLSVLALFPTLSAILSFYGLTTPPGAMQHQIQSLRFVVPPEVIQLLHKNLGGLSRQPSAALFFSLAISVILALWVASRAIVGIIGALNIVYGEVEQRGVVRLAVTAFSLALGSLLFWVGALVAIVGAPLVLSQLKVDSALMATVIFILRWGLMAITAEISMTLLYFFGPSHHHARLRWLSVGSISATLLWLAGSALLSLYTHYVNDFSSVYGQLGVFVVLQLWFFLTAFVFLVGAEINVEVENLLHPAERNVSKD